MQPEYQIEYKRYNVVPENVSDAGTFDGRLAVYKTMDRGRDIILPGAVSEALDRVGWKVRMLYDHDPAKPIGAMHLKDSDDALLAHSEFNLEKQIALDAYSDVKFFEKKGMPMGLSIGFFVVGRDGQEIDEKKNIRYLKRIEIIEGSVVSFPMHDDARTTAVKSLMLSGMAANAKNIRDFEEFLRESGFSKREAVALASHGWKDFRRDAEEGTTDRTEALVRADSVLSLFR